MIGLSAVQLRYQVATDPLRTERRVELAMLISVLLLIGLLVYGVSRLALLSAPPAVVPTEDALQVVTPLEIATVTAEQSNEIRQRPVLWSERRPGEAVAEVPDSRKERQQEIKEFKEIKLLGVFGVGDSIGIIAKIKDKTQRVHVGGELAGWTLESVGTNDAIFTMGKRREKLVLLQGTPKSPDKVKSRNKHNDKMGVSGDSKKNQ